MEKKLFSFIIILLLLTVGLYFMVRQGGNQTEDIKNISINGNNFQVEVVDTKEEMKLGLGERDSLCRTCGMIFEYPKEGEYRFWMKGMRFPIDIIWISREGTIVHIEKNIPPDFMKTMTSPDPAIRVLEINGGLSDEYDIKIGDSIKL